MIRPIFAHQSHVKPTTRWARIAGYRIIAAIAIALAGLGATTTSAMATSGAAVETIGVAVERPAVQVSAAIHWTPVDGPHPALRTATAVRPLTATCYEYGCDNTDPVDTGCADGSQYTVASAAVTIGNEAVATINLRYSPTCGTNWAQITELITNYDLAIIGVCRLPNSCASEYDTTAPEAWSNQMYAYDIPAKAYATVYLDTGQAYGYVTA